MIFQIFKYYAQFPDLKGVISLFANGKSDIPAYIALRDEIQNIPTHSRIPEIKHYVFGQSYDSVKSRIDQISGTYLFLEFGEIESIRDRRNSIQDTFDLAVTIASKIQTTSDLVEQAIISQQTLGLIHQLRTLQHEDQARQSWLKEISDRHTIVPFVAREFASLGWTIVFKREGADLLNLKQSLNINPNKTEQ